MEFDKQTDLFDPNLPYSTRLTFSSHSLSEISTTQNPKKVLSYGPHGPQGPLWGDSDPPTPNFGSWTPLLSTLRLPTPSDDDANPPKPGSKRRMTPLSAPSEQYAARYGTFLPKNDHFHLFLDPFSPRFETQNLVNF